MEIVKQICYLAVFVLNPLCQLHRSIFSLELRRLQRHFIHRSSCRFKRRRRLVGRRLASWMYIKNGIFVIVAASVQSWSVAAAAALSHFTIIIIIIIIIFCAFRFRPLLLPLRGVLLRRRLLFVSSSSLLRVR